MPPVVAVVGPTAAGKTDLSLDLAEALDGDKITQGMDKAAQAVDKKTGHKHTDKIAQGKTKAQEALDKLDGKDDDFPKNPPPTR